MPHTLHSRAGSHVIVTNGNKTAFRNHPGQEFNDGVVLSSEPLLENDLFEVKIDKKINSWSGSIEIGVTTSDPHNLSFPTSATGFRSGTWVMSGSSVLRDGHTIIEEYGKDLDQLGEGDQVGVLKTDTGNLHFYVNGEDQGVAAESIPDRVFVVIDLYGKCCQVTVVEESNTENVEPTNQVAEDNSTSVSLEVQSNDQLCFHSRCGSLIRLTRGRRTAERRRPLDEFNNGVIMTNRPLQNDELFEIRLDHLVDKWSGSIEIGISTHNPSTLEFPATMTNMRSGYIILNGCSILAHGKEILREYSVYNLDELREGDRIGLIRNSNGNLHFLINGIDQGLAISQAPSPVWGVVDLYGMAVKVSITDRRDRNQRRNEDLFAQQMRAYMQVQDEILEESEEPADRLIFHTHCGSHAAVMAGGRTAYRPNAVEEFNNGVVLTSRMLKPGEMFEVRLDKIIDKWAGSIEIGVTTHTPTNLDFPSTMTNIRSGTWMMTGNGVMHNGTTVIDEYGQNLDRLQSGDRIAALRKMDGILHFYVNGEDQGLAASNVPTNIYGVIDLYGQAAQATIIDHSSSAGERDIGMTNHDDLRFNHLHGSNVVISQGGKTASRPNARGEFNDGIVMSNRPLKDNELFEITVDRMVDRWSGSIEAGVTLIHPADIDFPSTMTDIDYETWMLSGSAIMQDGATIRNGYKLDLDTLVVGSKIGMMHCSDGTLHYYFNGLDQGVACVDIPSGVYAVIDLYGQCAQVSISGTRSSHRSDNQILLDIDQSLTSPLTSEMMHRFSQCCGKNIAMRNNGQTACRMWNFNHGLVFSTDPLRSDEIFEIKVEKLNKQWSSSMSIGLTTMAISDCTPVSLLPATLSELRSKVTWIISGANVTKNGKIIKENYTPSLDRLDIGSRIGVRRCSDATMHLYIDGEDIGIAASNLPKNVFAVIDVYGIVEQVSITSSGFTEFLNSSRPPSIHSLESIDSIEDEELERDTSEVVCFEFHQSHGKNIKIMNHNLSAKRTASYNQAVVISHKPLVRNKLFQVKIDKLNKKWSSSLCIGVMAVKPEKFTFPLTAVSIKKQSWIIQGSSVFENGVKTKNGYGPDLDTLLSGQTVGVLVDDSSMLRLHVNGIDQGIAAKDIPKSCYVVLDLYGQCEQVSLINTEGQIIENCNAEEGLPEKGYKEEKKKEKEKIARPIDVETQTKNCEYFNMCARFRSTLGIPENYFNHAFNRCFCECCHRMRGEASHYRQGDPLREYSIPIGWSRFGIRLPAKAEATNSQDKWHVGYTGAQISVIRTVLDSGDLLVMGEALSGRWSLCSKLGIFDEKNKPDEPVDTMPISLSPFIQYAATKSCSPRYDHRDPKTRKTQSLRLAFQVFVKPGSYKIGPQCSSSHTPDLKLRNSDIEWVTKERGATVVCGLLIKVE